MENLKVSAVIVNYNSGSWLGRCLAALSKSQVAQIIVVDNASVDNSLDCLQSKARANVKLIQNPDNPGYAAACNQGLESIDSEFILFLNPDCELLDNALSSLCAALISNPRAILAGPWVIDSKGNVQRATLRRLPTLKNSISEFFRPGNPAGVDLSQTAKPVGTQKVEAVSGACLLARTDMLRKLNGFDPGYILHCEDLDLMRRAETTEYDVVLVPDALVMHQQGVSSRSRPYWVEWQKHRGMWRYYKKFEGREENIFKRAFVRAGIFGHYLIKAFTLVLKRIQGN